ncbi:MAG: FtsQ-type POTRA domain-containing protein [Oscillospiraceae bacterium]|jgi:cell division protein FtsQ|nr:FtsQ-type POTRA domain-containing protein [Oscillospiraceae bacterium]
MTQEYEKRRGSGVFVGSVSVLLILAAVVLAVSVFFRVSSIEVTGAGRYTEQEIIDASGLEIGSNLIFLNRAAAAGRITDALPYAGSVEVKRALPNKIVIEVRESGRIACVPSQTEWWLIDNNCRALEECPAEELGDYLSVTGFYITEPVAGRVITVPDEDRFKVEYLAALLTALQASDMLTDVATINLETSANPQLTYLGRFTVKLGDADGLDSKLTLLKNAAAQLDDGARGFFDLTKDKQANFLPE